MVHELKKTTWVPPGHHYSPIPNNVLIKEQRDSVFHLREHLPGVVIDEQKQVQFLETMKSKIESAPFDEKPIPGTRYFYDNAFFGHADALTLYALMHYAKPKHIIDIGTGFSTALMLDTNEKYFNNDIQITCIESYKGSISDLLRREKKLDIVDQDLYEVDKSLFENLQPNDILFVDSTHVSKTGSDVNYIVHEVLPILPAGVYVHFHDVMANFEYPIEWVEEGRAWNEAYLLRSFLTFNNVYEIFLFNAYFGTFHRNYLKYNLPLFLKNTGGSLWLKKER